MKGKYLILLSFLLSVGIESDAIEMIQAKWLHQAASDSGETLFQDVLGDNALNVYIVSDNHVSWNQLLEYAQKESDYFLQSVPYSYVYNVVVVQVNNLGFYKQGLHGYPAKSVRPVIISLAKRAYSANDFLVYVNSFENTSGVTTGGYDGITPSETDGLDWNYVSADLDLSFTGTVAHELGHLITDLADEYFALGTGRSFQLNELNKALDGRVEQINLWGDINYISTGEIIDGEPANINIIDIPIDKIPWAVLIEDDVPLPTFRTAKTAFGEMYFASTPSQSIKNYSIGAFSRGNILFVPTTGRCIMNSPDERWGYCPVCEQAWTVQALNRTQEVNISHHSGQVVVPQSKNLSPSTSEPFLSISFPETQDERSVYWLINGVTDENRANKTSWSTLELRDLSDQSLTLRVVNETAKESLVYNPYSNITRKIFEDDNFVGDKELFEIYTEEFTWVIKEPDPPTPTPTHTPTPTNTNTPTSVPTPTPAQLFGVTISPDMEQFGLYVVAWQWSIGTQNPNGFEIHIYKDGTFQRRVQPSLPGNTRSVKIDLTEPGTYTVFVAPVFGTTPNGTDFKPSNFEVKPTPTPIPPTNVEQWWMY